MAFFLRTRWHLFVFQFAWYDCI